MSNNAVALAARALAILLIGTHAMHRVTLASTVTETRLSPTDSVDAVLAKAVAVRPTPRQIAWQRDEISAFVHFGMNTFTDREWGDGTEDPKLFNPTALDARQWARAAKAAGISRMILTAKHHDGFCLWPSRFTEHCVRNSPWKDGKGDVVREFVEACRAEGLHYGIYLSPWDRHEKTYGDSPRYNQYFLNQLRELLTSYPGVSEVWFDGACAEGPNGKRQEYDWRAYWTLIRELAPEAAITVRGPDVRWCGNEAGHSRKSEWSVIPMPGDGESWETSDATLTGYTRDIHGNDLGSRDMLMRSRADRATLAWYPSQVNTSIRPGWFYHSSEDGRVRTLHDLLTVYYGSVGGNGQFLLNVPPDRRGLFHENDVARLKEFGDVLRATFSSNLASGAKLTTQVAGGESIGDVGALLHADPDTFWTTTDGPISATITVELPASVRANCLMLQEYIASGQRVEAFEVDVFENGDWRPAAKGTVVGYKHLLRFADVTTSKFRIRFTQFRIRPTLSSIGLYLAPAIRAIPEATADGNRLARAKWKILECDSQDDVEGDARNAIDGDLDTFWHSRYRNGVDPMPHHLSVDLGETVTIAGFAYTPRQDQWEGGIVIRARFEVSDDGKRWSVAADNVDFDNIVNSRQEQVVKLTAPTNARFFRMTALRTAKDENLASAADVSVIVTPQATERAATQLAPEMPPEARRAFDRPIVLGPDDVPAFPDPPADIDVKRDGIAHGKVEVAEYESKTVRTRRKMLVYLPPGYRNDQKYPVLYLMHGIGGNEYEWTGYCHSDTILDNLIADGKTVPMIVVMPNGRAQKDDRVPENIFAAAPAFAVFERDLLDDVIPAVESRYRVQADREHRALAGLSMGGGQALNFGLAHPDVFAWVGAFSPAPNTKPPTELLPDPARAKQLKLLWLACGNKDGLINMSQRVHAYLKQNDFPHVWHVSDAGHDAAAWKPNLYLFAQRIFRDGGRGTSNAGASQ